MNQVQIEQALREAYEAGAGLSFDLYAHDIDGRVWANFRSLLLKEFETWLHEKRSKVTTEIMTKYQLKAAEEKQR